MIKIYATFSTDRNNHESWVGFFDTESYAKIVAESYSYGNNTGRVVECICNNFEEKHIMDIRGMK